ncbi:MAG: V-type ATPase subunit [Monoglobus pectinilyticus]
MVEQYTYAVSRIHARELDLLSSSDLEQLLICPDFETALKYLTEKGYGIKDNYRSFEELEKDETEKMWELINELIPDKTPFETLLRQIDFHNLKAAIKSVFTAEEAEGYFLRGGTVEPQVILNAVKIKNYSELPEFLSGTAVEATEKFAETGDGQECDIYIDRRCLETILSEGTASDVSIIKDYAELFVALVILNCCQRPLTKNLSSCSVPSRM